MNMYAGGGTLYLTNFCIFVRWLNVSFASYVIDFFGGGKRSPPCMYELRRRKRGNDMSNFEYHHIVHLIYYVLCSTLYIYSTVLLSVIVIWTDFTARIFLHFLFRKPIIGWKKFMIHFFDDRIFWLFYGNFKEFDSTCQNMFISPLPQFVSVRICGQISK